MNSEAVGIAFRIGTVPDGAVHQVLLRSGEVGVVMPHRGGGILPDRRLVNALRDARVVRRGFEQTPAAELG